MSLRLFPHSSFQTPFEQQMFQLCRDGQIKTIKDFISVNILGQKDFNKGLCGACEGGHPEVVELMIEHEAWWWHDGLISISKGFKTNLSLEKRNCYFKIIEMMFGLIETQQNKLMDIDFFNADLNYVLSVISSHHDYQMVIFILDFFKFDDVHWQDCLNRACQYGGNIEIVKWIMMQHSCRCFDLTAALCGASTGRHADIVKFLIKSQPLSTLNWKRAILWSDVNQYIPTLWECGADPNDLYGFIKDWSFFFNRGIMFEGKRQNLSSISYNHCLSQRRKKQNVIAQCIRRVKHVSLSFFTARFITPCISFE